MPTPSLGSLNQTHLLPCIALGYPPFLSSSNREHPHCRSVAWLGNGSISTQLGAQGKSARVLHNGISGGENNQGVAALRREMNVKSSITDWKPGGSCVKVVGLGARATSLLQFCNESMLLSSTEFWIPCGDPMNLQAFELLNKASIRCMDGSSLDGALAFPAEGVQDNPGVVVLVIGIGAAMCGKVASDILESSRVPGGLSVMVVIQPFNFEGLRRRREIEELTASLSEHADLSFVFEHDALFRREKVTLAEALRLADKTVLLAIKAISDLCLGNRDKFYDSPPEGFREIVSSEVLSIFKHAGSAWVGFGSSYSIKSAVQRAALESPFLHSLVPGVKAIVACTVASAEPKDRKDLQAAVHALRCIIGPRAQLVCASVKEPTLRQGVILVTILVTRIDNGGSHESLKQSASFPDLSFPFASSRGSNNQSSSSMNGRELRKSNWGSFMDNFADVQDIRQLNSNCLIGLETHQSISFSDVDDSNDLVVDPSAWQNEHQREMDEADFEGNNFTRKPMNADCMQTFVTVDRPEDVAMIMRPPGLEKHYPADATTHLPIIEETCSGNGSQNSLSESVESENTHETKSDGSQHQEGFVQDGLSMTGRWATSENPISDKGDDVLSKWRIPTLPSILGWDKLSTGVKKKRFVGWESGPNSAAAEAWAKARQLENFGASDKKDVYKFPMGVKPRDDIETASYMLNRQQSPRQMEPLASPFDAVVPFSRVVSNGLGAVADIYNAASAKVLKKDGNEGNEEGKKGSSFLSQRAASMLETERSSKKLTPLVEMNYKNGVYRGRCCGGLPEGKGRLTYADGSFYDGLWKKGKQTGAGSFYYANGDVFQGCWRDDQMHGKGWLYFHTGDRLYSDFWKGKANGEGRYYSVKGEVFFGHFRENWRHGKCLSIEPSGIRWSETWDDGVLVSRAQLDNTELN